MLRTLGCSLAVLFALAGTGCWFDAGVETDSTVTGRAFYTRPDPVVVNTPPPPPQVSIETRPAQPMASSVWVDGYWDVQNGGYVWVGGHWDNPRQGYVWTPPVGVHVGGGFRYHGGYWRPASEPPHPDYNYTGDGVVQVGVQAGYAPYGNGVTVVGGNTSGGAVVVNTPPGDRGGVYVEPGYGQQQGGAVVVNSPPPNYGVQGQGGVVVQGGGGVAVNPGHAQGGVVVQPGGGAVAVNPGHAQGGVVVQGGGAVAVNPGHVQGGVAVQPGGVAVQPGGGAVGVQGAGNAQGGVGRPGGGVQVGAGNAQGGVGRPGGGVQVGAGNTQGGVGQAGVVQAGAGNVQGGVGRPGVVQGGVGTVQGGVGRPGGGVAVGAGNVQGGVGVAGGFTCRTSMAMAIRGGNYVVHGSGFRPEAHVLIGGSYAPVGRVGANEIQLTVPNESAGGNVEVEQGGQRQVCGNVRVTGAGAP